MRLVPKHWREFQHYRDRRPPWIKLHRKLLDDRAYLALPVASLAIAPLLWLLASESEDGSFEADIKELEFRLRLSGKTLSDGLKGLTDSGFLTVASNALAPCQQDATCSLSSVSVSPSVPLLSSEGEREREERRRSRPDRPDDVSEQVWADWTEHRRTKKASISETVIRKHRAEAVLAGITLEAAMEHCCSAGWQGFRADWFKDSKGSAAAPARFNGRPSRPIEHMRNMPVGMPSCGCEECIRYREKRKVSS